LKRAGAEIGDRLLFVVMQVVLICGYGAKFLHRGPGKSDFWTFWLASRTVLHGADPYPALASLPHVASKWFAPFVYPPVAAFLLAPLGVLPFLLAKIAFFALNLVALAVALRLLGVRDWRCYSLAIISPPAIEAARALTAELELSDRASFVLSNVYDAPAMLAEAGGFDRVFVSWRALCWLPDMRAWAGVVAHFLRPGGYLALAEAHPAAYVLDDSVKTADGRPGWFAPYLGRAPIPMDNPLDYADPQARLVNSRTVEFLHPLSDVISGLLAAGLRLERIAEHDAIVWQMFECLIHDGSTFRWPDRPWFPLSYSLRAERQV